MRIAIDIDNCLLHWQRHWPTLYCEWFDTAIDWDELGSWNACLDLTHFNDMPSFYDWFDAANGWKTQTFVPGARGFLYNLRELQRKQSNEAFCDEKKRITWVFVTSRPTAAGKLAAIDLAASLYGSQVAFANDDSKHQQNCDIWIDDSPAVLESLAQAGKKAIRFNRPWNTPATYGGTRPGAPCTYAADNWNQVMDILVSREGMLQ